MVTLGDSVEASGVSVLNKQLLTTTQRDATNHPELVGAVKFFSENDDGAHTGSPFLLSPETDDDARLRTSNDMILDTETFNYAVQNTGKHTFGNATMTASWATSGLTTNSGNVNTSGYGLTFGTYREFPVFGNHNLYMEFEGSFSSLPVANAIIDFGAFRRGASAAYAPTDGVFFRHNSGGIFGVISYGGSEVVVPFNDPFVYALNEKHQFIITITQRHVAFWIDNELYGEKVTPVGQGQPFLSSSLPLSIRHAHVGTAGGIINFCLNNYTISLGGPVYAESFASRTNALMGSFQGFSGGTMGALMSGTITTGTLVMPTAAIPSNTALTANLCNSLAGRSQETFTTGLALNTDGILQSFQVPLGTTAIPGKTLKIRGIKLSSFVQTVMAGGTAIINEFKLAFGSTSASLQTPEAAATKKPRYVMLPELTQALALTQAAFTQLSQPGGMVCNFQEPIYVNPGEFVSLVITHQGTTIPTSGIVCNDIQYDYSWE